METVSVIIVSYNAAAFIAQALDSALSQTHRPFEILVLDDSTDSTPQIVESYAKQHGDIIKLYRVARVNVSVKRNMGLDLVQGQMIAYLDADDIWLPTKTEKQLALLRESPQAVGAYAHYFDFLKEIDDLGRRVPRNGKDDPDLRDVVFEQHMSSSTTLIRRSALGSLRFDEAAPDAEDTLLVAELRLKGNWRLVDEALIAKRIHATQTSTSAKHRIRNVKARLRWLGQRAELIGTQRADELQRELTAGWIGWMENCYWRRELTDLKWMCDEARQVCPQAFGKSFLSKTRIYPRWVYRLRDWMKK